jgi:hypothetical protein
VITSSEATESSEDGDRALQGYEARQENTSKAKI